MLFSKLQVGIAATCALAIVAGLFREVRETGRLRSQVSGQSRSAIAGLAVLEKQVAAEKQHVTVAEANVATLLKAAETAGSPRVTVPPRAGAITDTADAAKAAMARASRLIKDGKLQEALEEYLACYRELRAIRPGSGECQQLMSAIRNLGRTYPAAMVALAGLRDAAMTQRQAEPERGELASEIALLNERLGEGSRTLALYDALPPNDPGRRSLARIANVSFIAARRYTDALIGKPFGEMLSLIESGARQVAMGGASQDASRQAAMRKAIVDGTVTNIEVLTGAGKHGEAKTLTVKLLAFDGSETTRTAVQRHVDRAQAPKE